MRGMAEHSSTASQSTLERLDQKWSLRNRGRSQGPVTILPLGGQQSIASPSLEENRDYIGAIARFEAIGGDTNDIVNYEILKPCSWTVRYERRKSGEVYIYERLDFEQIEEYTIEVAATDLGGAQDSAHTLNIEVV